MEAFTRRVPFLQHTPNQVVATRHLRIRNKESSLSSTTPPPWYQRHEQEQGDPTMLEIVAGSPCTDHPGRGTMPPPTEASQPERWWPPGSTARTAERTQQLHQRVLGAPD